MIKAIIKMKDGTEVSVEGTPEEVAKTKELITKQEKTIKTKKAGKRQKEGPVGLILELKSEKFFDKPRTIGEIKQKLEEKAYHYPASSLSPALIRLTKKRELGRLKKDGSWVWVKR